MGLFDLTDTVLQRGLEGASLRQQVLSNNLANANTAGFKRSDVDFQSSLASALGSSDPSQSLDSLAFTPQADSSTTMTLDGNNVDTDTEMANLTSNAVEYETLAAIEQQRFATLKAAMGS